MTAQEAINLARDFASQQGYDVERYEPTANHSDGEWHVFFLGQDLRPGNFFSVYVDEASATVRELIPGK